MLQWLSHVLPMVVKPHPTGVHLLVYYVNVKKRWIFWGYLRCLVRTAMLSVGTATFVYLSVGTVTFVHLPAATTIDTWFCNNGHPSLSDISSICRRSAQQKTKPFVRNTAVAAPHYSTQDQREWFLYVAGFENRRKSRFINHKASVSITVNEHRLCDQTMSPHNNAKYPEQE
jgi:hypothetical protein